MSDPVRVQIISESTFVDTLKKANAPNLDLTDHQLPDSDQNFGFAEAAAVIALVTSITELIHVLVKVYKEINDDNLEVTIKTVDEVITVKGRQARNVDYLMKQFQNVT